VRNNGALICKLPYFEVNPVKPLLSFLLLSTTALSQSPDSPRIVTFNRADTEHCKVAVVSGKPLLETTYDGTTVAITLPQNWGNGEFSVYVAVAQVGEGEAVVNPKEISALYPDPAHTRFRWFDKARDLDTLASMRAAGMGGGPSGGPGGSGPPGGPGGSGSIGDSNSANPPPTHPEAMGQMDPHAGNRSEEEARQLQLRNGAGTGSTPAPLDPAHPPAFLRLTTVKQGSNATGYVFLRRPKGSKVEVVPAAMLDEIDIPINGVIFRF
jgi:hypothetical protein